jgi:hypothetical protein
MKWLRNLIKRLHRHRWEDTFVNGWAIAIEQRCRCGEYRHHRWKDWDGEHINWQPGRFK